MNSNEKRISEIATISTTQDFYIFNLIHSNNFVVSSSKEAINAIKEVVNNNKLIIVSEEVAKLVEDKIESYKSLVYPIFLVLPTTNSCSEYGLKIIKNIACDALGIDILKE